MRKAVVAGHISLDISPRLDRLQSQNAVSDVFSPGKLIEIHGTDIHLGGAVANTGLAMRKLGASVALCGKIGNDAFGKLLHGILCPEPGDCIGTDDRCATSYSVILAVPGMDRIIFHEPGANHHFCNDDIPDSALEDAALFHFGYPPLMKSIYENQGEELIRIFQRMKEKRILTSLDMALVNPDTVPGKIDWRRYLRRVLPLTDLFVPSFEELFLMLRREEYIALTSCGTKPLDRTSMKKECPALAEALLEMGCRVILIKCGSEGLYYRSSAEGIGELADALPIRPEEWRELEGFQPAYPVEKVVSAVGAGDVCIAGFLASALEGRPLRECAALAAAEGACSVTAYDALSALVQLDCLKKKHGIG